MYGVTVKVNGLELFVPCTPSSTVTEILERAIAVAKSLGY